MRNIVILLLLVCGIIWIGLHSDPYSTDLSKLLAPPSLEEPLGYDELGRSVLDRLVSGAYLAFYVAFLVMILSASIGTLIGIVSGYFGGIVDDVLMRIVDIFLAFPGLLLALLLAAILGPGINNLIIALVSVSWVGYARLMRAQTLSLKQRDYIDAARCFGVPTPRIWFVHILPLAGSALLVEATFGCAGAILSEAGLSFLGLGVQPPDASWGQMIREGARYMLVAPHLILVPSITLLVCIWSINYLGEKMRKIVLPHLEVS